MNLSFDPAKRRQTIKSRVLDFADADLVFAGRTTTVEDQRRDYGEVRNLTAGSASGQDVVLVWTPRDNCRHIISMRARTERDAEKWFGGD